MNLAKRVAAVLVVSILLTLGPDMALAAQRGGASGQPGSLAAGLVATQSDDDSAYSEDDSSPDEPSNDEGVEDGEDIEDDEDYASELTDLSLADVYIYEIATLNEDDDEYEYEYSMKRRAYTGKAIRPEPIVAINPDGYYDDEDDSDDGDDYEADDDEWDYFAPDPSDLSELELGVDYELSYENNVKVGVATVYVTGIGDFTGTISETFRICAPISKAKASKVSAKTFTGKAIKPAPKVTYSGKKLKKGKDYTLSYKTNTKVGKATIKITGKGNYIGTKTIKFKIKKRSIKKAKVAKISNQRYTGKALKPNPKVTVGSTVLKKGVDYTVSYAKNKARGTAKVTIKGKGNYTGKRTATFKIVGAKKTSAKASSGKSASRKSRAGNSAYSTSGASGSVYITNTGAKFHASGCRFLRSSKIPISRNDALARGYEPCKICNP